MSEECWKDIEGFEGRYQVSNMGRVKSLPRIVDLNNSKVSSLVQLPGRIMVLAGYRKTAASLQVGKGKKTSFSIWILMAKAFIGPPPTPTSIAVPRDGDYTHMTADNTKYIERRDYYFEKEARRDHPKGSKSINHKLDEDKVKEIKRMIANKESSGYIAARFGVHRTTIQLIARGKFWSHVALDVPTLAYEGKPTEPNHHELENVLAEEPV